MFLIRFWGILVHPRAPGQGNEHQRFANEEQRHEKPEELKSMKDKLKAIPPLFKFMIPLCLVYFFEYFINQGLVS